MCAPVVWCARQAIRKQFLIFLVGALEVDFDIHYVTAICPSVLWDVGETRGFCLKGDLVVADNALFKFLKPLPDREAHAITVKGIQDDEVINVSFVSNLIFSVVSTENGPDTDGRTVCATFDILEFRAREGLKTIRDRKFVRNGSFKGPIPSSSDAFIKRAHESAKSAPYASIEGAWRTPGRHRDLVGQESKLLHHRWQRHRLRHITEGARRVVNTRPWVIGKR